MSKTETPTPQAPLPLILRGPVVLLAPAPDRRVRKPDGHPLAEVGESVNVDEAWSYWARRCADGDVIAVPELTNGDDA